MFFLLSFLTVSVCAGLESNLCCAIRDDNLAALNDLLRDEVEIRKTLRERWRWERKAISFAAVLYHSMAKKGFSPMHVAAG